MKATAKILLFAVVWVGCGLIGSAGLRAFVCGDTERDKLDYPYLYSHQNPARSVRQMEPMTRAYILLGPGYIVVAALYTGIFMDGLMWSTDQCTEAQ
jgi:hypothetical protein